MDRGSDYLARLKILTRKHDIIPVQVFDPLEKGIPLPGLTQFFDLESGRTFFSDSGDHRFSLPETGFAATIKLSTGESIESAVLDFFEKRKKGRALN